MERNLRITRKHSSKRILHVVITLLAAASIGLIVYSIGRPFAFPWDFQIQLTSPSAVAGSNQGIVIVDSSSQRLLILDSNYNVIGSEKFGGLGDPAERIDDVEMNEDAIYVLAIDYHSGGQYISEEKILKYDYEGDLQEVLATETVPLTEHRTMTAICDIGFSSDGAMLVARRTGNELQLIQANEQNAYGTQTLPADEVLVDRTLASHVFDASISTEAPTVAVTTDNGNLSLCSDESIDRVTSEIEDFGAMLPSYVCITSDGSLVFNDSLSGNLYKYVSSSQSDTSVIPVVADEDIHTCETGRYFTLLSNVQVGGVDHLGENLVVTLVDSDSFYIMGADGAAITQLSACGMAPLLMLRVVLTWFAVLYLLVLAVIVAVRLEFFKSGWIKLSTCVVIVLLVGGSMVYSQKSSITYSDSVDAELLALTQFVTQAETQRIGDTMQQFVTDQVDNRSLFRSHAEMIDEVSDLLNVYIESSSEVDLDRFYRLFTISDAGDIYVLVDSTGFLQRGSPIHLDELHDHIVKNLAFYEEGNCDVVTVMGTSRNREYCISPVFASDGTFVGLCSFGYFYDTQMREQFVGTLDQLMFAWVLLAICFLILSQGKVVQRAFDSIKRHRADGDKRSAVVKAAHPANFLKTAAISTDSLLAVVIITDMAQARGFDYVICSASGVLALQALGAIFGAITAKLLSRKLPARTIFIGASIVTLMALAGCVIGAVCNSLTLFLAFKTISGFSLCGVLAELVTLFRYQGDPGAQRDEEEKAVRWGNISSTILSVMAAGYLVEAFGNPAAYVLSFLFASALFIVGAKVLPVGFCFTDSYQSEEIDLRDSAKKITTLFKPKMFAVVVLLGLPLILVSGYNSYLYPLIADGYNLKVTYITNIYVIARAIAYLVHEVPYALMRRGVNLFGLSATSMLVICLTLLGFVLNQDMLWAVVTLVILAAMTDLAGACVKPIRDDIIIEHGYRPKDYTTVIAMVDSILKVIQPLLLGAFILLGGSGSVACAILGGVTLLCIALFALAHQRIRATTGKPRRNEA